MKENYAVVALTAKTAPNDDEERVPVGDCIRHFNEERTRMIGENKKTETMSKQ
jgi:hypothetical protein